MKAALRRFMSDYGMIFVLLLLCVYYSWRTYALQYPVGAAAGREAASSAVRQLPRGASVLIVGRDHAEDKAFVEAARQALETAGMRIAAAVTGQPADARQAMQSLADAGGRLDAVVANQVTGAWGVFSGLAERFPAFAGTKVITPPAHGWPNFLKRDNLLNVADQIVVIAIIAVGMTMVIITAGIDLSVGSLIALSAVVATMLMRDLAGAQQATAIGMTLCCLAAIAVCGLVGAFSGVMVTVFAIPPFIVTLGMLLVAKGTAFILARGESIPEVPDSFVWLGREASVLGAPNAVLLMLAIYVAAHVLMSHTTLGRYIYAVGGNAEAARLSGVRVRAVLLFVYIMSGALAGLGGVVLASRLKSGSATYGDMYELYVIAAVVVGGTSLSGGQGRIFGTLIGAFIIAVIQNGMNLTNVESYKQRVVLGLVILGAVLLDTLKNRGVPGLKWLTARMRQQAIS